MSDDLKGLVTLKHTHKKYDTKGQAFMVPVFGESVLLSNINTYLEKYIFILSVSESMR